MTTPVLSVPRATENTVDDDELALLHATHHCPFRAHVEQAVSGPMAPSEWWFWAERMVFGRSPAECGTEETEEL